LRAPGPTIRGSAAAEGSTDPASSPPPSRLASIERETALRPTLAGSMSVTSGHVNCAFVTSRTVVYPANANPALAAACSSPSPVGRRTSRTAPSPPLCHVRRHGFATTVTTLLPITTCRFPYCRSNVRAQRSIP
jgi:hypothetical protein